MVIAFREWRSQITSLCLHRAVITDSRKLIVQILGKLQWHNAHIKFCQISFGGVRVETRKRKEDIQA
jgi:hypothetical protein